MLSYFGSDLVSALAGLDVDDLSHGVSCCFGGGSSGNAEPGPHNTEPRLGHVTRTWLAPGSPLIGQLLSTLASDWPRQPLVTGSGSRPATAAPGSRWAGTSQ